MALAPKDQHQFNHRVGADYVEKFNTAVTAYNEANGTQLTRVAFTRLLIDAFSADPNLIISSSSQKQPDVLLHEWPGLIRTIRNAFTADYNEVIANADTFRLAIRDFERWCRNNEHQGSLFLRFLEGRTTIIETFYTNDREKQRISEYALELLSLLPNKVAKSNHRKGRIQFRIRPEEFIFPRDSMILVTENEAYASDFSPHSIGQAFVYQADVAGGMHEQYVNMFDQLSRTQFETCDVFALVLEKPQPAP